jgi:hypothetical protein
MASSKPLWHGAGTLLALLGLVGSVSVTWTGIVAGSLKELVSGARLLEEEQQRECSLEARQRTVFAYREAKDRVAREVAAGRRSLVEGTARFRALCLETPAFRPEIVRQYYGGDSEEECYGRALIDRVRGALADDPAQAQEVASRLEAELVGLLNQGAPAYRRLTP